MKTCSSDKTEKLKHTIDHRRHNSRSVIYCPLQENILLLTLQTYPTTVRVSSDVKEIIYRYDMKKRKGHSCRPFHRVVMTTRNVEWSNFSHSQSFALFSSTETELVGTKVLPLILHENSSNMTDRRDDQLLRHKNYHNKCKKSFHLSFSFLELNFRFNERRDFFFTRWTSMNY